MIRTNLQWVIKYLNPALKKKKKEKTGSILKYLNNKNFKYQIISDLVIALKLKRGFSLKINS